MAWRDSCDLGRSRACDVLSAIALGHPPGPWWTPYVGNPVELSPVAVILFHVGLKMGLIGFRATATAVGSSTARLRTWSTGNRVARHGALRRKPGPVVIHWSSRATRCKLSCWRGVSSSDGRQE